jgi:hypothetical protein
MTLNGVYLEPVRMFGLSDSRSHGLSQAPLQFKFKVDHLFGIVVKSSTYFILEMISYWWGVRRADFGSQIRMGALAL